MFDTDKQMVSVVVLSANGESRTLKTAAITEVATGDAVAKALRKARTAEHIGSYTWKEQTLQLWGWRTGKTGTENQHELPAPHDEVALFGDAVVVLVGGELAVEVWKEFAAADDEDIVGGQGKIGGEDEDIEDEDGGEDEDDDEENDVEEEAEADEDVEEDAEEEEDEEEEDEGADDDCYEDGDDAGGGKRRAPRRRTTSAPEYRRMDMGLRSRVKIPTPVGKRAPRWQTAAELEMEPYNV
jgi:hypothetical protein